MGDNDKFLMEMERVKLQTRRIAKSAVTRAGGLVMAEAVKQAPKDTGQLQQSIQTRVIEAEDCFTARVWSGLFYAPYVHEGTGMYARNKNGRPGLWRYRIKRGPHAGWYTTRGNKANPFFERAFKAKKDDVLKILHKAAETAAKLSKGANA